MAFVCGGSEKGISQLSMNNKGDSSSSLSIHGGSHMTTSRSFFRLHYDFELYLTAHKYERGGASSRLEGSAFSGPYSDCVVIFVRSVTRHTLGCRL